MQLVSRVLETMGGLSVMHALHSTCSCQACRLRPEGDQVKRVLLVSQCARLQRGEKGDRQCCCPLRKDSVGSGAPAQIWCQMCEGHAKAVQWVNTILPYDLAVTCRDLRSDGPRLLHDRTEHGALESHHPLHTSPFWLALRTNYVSAESRRSGKQRGRNRSLAA